MMRDWESKVGYRLMANVSELRHWLRDSEWQFYSMIYNEQVEDYEMVRIYTEKFSCRFHAEEMEIWAKSYFPRKHKEAV